MPSLKQTRRRIASVRNTEKITRAMKLVSAAKFARANRAVRASERYARAFEAMMQRVLSGATAQQIESLAIARQRTEKKILVALISTDRGLCGSLNAQLFKTVKIWIDEKIAAGCSVTVAPWGRRAQLVAKKFKWPVILPKEKVLEGANSVSAERLLGDLIGEFEGGQCFDAVYVAHSAFRSALTQVPSVARFLPLKVAQEGTAPVLMTIEPSPEVVIPDLVRRSGIVKLFRCLLEGAASEHGSRMTAMDSATRNAKEVIRKLTLEYNRARQAAITKELIEITSGADALN